MNRFYDVLDSRVPSWVRQAFALVVLLAGLGIFAAVANAHYPLRHWLFFVLARMWVFGLVFVLASLAAGWRILKWILPEPSVLGERLVLSFAIGVLVFVCGIFLCGIVGCLGLVVFFAWPAAMLLFGGPTLVRDARRIGRRLRPFGFRLLQPRSAIEAASAVGIVVSVVAIYLQVMTPANVSFDAQWYHLPMAEQYASSGRISPFAEGWYLGAIPQLSSLIYTWAFISPGALYDHIALAAHLEWFVFLATLVGVSVLARRLLGGRRVPYAAVAVFLFPGIFLYDSALGLMADHVMAFWGPPLALALFRLRRWFAVREAAVAALMTSAAALTKYQSSYMVSGAILATLALTIRRRRLAPLLAYAAVGLFVTSIHWLKNIFFYGNPVYPFAHAIFHGSHPFRAGGERLVGTDHLAVQFALNGTPAYRLAETAKALFTFSFLPHDWFPFHGDRPVFGSLFTLLLPLLLVIRATPELWITVVAVHLGIALWFMISHEDRYIQNLLPWMAACTAAILTLTWQRAARPVRAALVALVAFQIVWGGDLYFLRTHAMIGDSFLKKAVDFIAAGHEKRYEERFRYGSALQDIGPKLPKDAKVLLHTFQERLGIGRPSVADSDEWQLGIDYVAYPTAKTTFDVWKSMGITHAIWRSELGASTIEGVAREAVFAEAIDRYGADTRPMSGYLLSRLDASAARAGGDTPTKVAWFGCGADPRTGVYAPANLAQRWPERLISPLDFANDATQALAGVTVAVLRPGCPDVAPAVAELNSSFKRVMSAGDVSIWVRR
jgi:hypothetical protein